MAVMLRLRLLVALLIGTRAALAAASANTCLAAGCAAEGVEDPAFGGAGATELPGQPMVINMIQRAVQMEKAPPSFHVNADGGSETARLGQSHGAAKEPRRERGAAPKSPGGSMLQNKSDPYYYKPGTGGSYGWDPYASSMPGTTTEMPVPEGMNKLENAGKDCQKACMNLGVENAGKGYCDWCGKGNACCQYNDPAAPDECSAVDEAPFLDEWGFVQQLAKRCVYPKAGNVSNYQQFVDDTFAMIKDIGQEEAPPTEKSNLTAPKEDFPGYKREKGKGKPPAYLRIGTVKEKADNYETLSKMPEGCCLPSWRAKCPALGDPQYAISTEGLFDNFTYTTYPYMFSQGSELEMSLFCGARYTDDPSPATSKRAAEVAREACDDMGDLCGGFSVGTDPECCGNKGCTETIFLNPTLKEDLIDPTPASSKTHTYLCNYYTWIKQ